MDNVTVTLRCSGTREEVAAQLTELSRQVAEGLTGRSLVEDPVQWLVADETEAAAQRAMVFDDVAQIVEAFEDQRESFSIAWEAEASARRCRSGSPLAKARWKTHTWASNDAMEAVSKARTRLYMLGANRAGVDALDVIRAVKAIHEKKRAVRHVWRREQEFCFERGGGWQSCLTRCINYYGHRVVVMRAGSAFEVELRSKVGGKLRWSDGEFTIGPFESEAAAVAAVDALAEVKAEVPAGTSEVR